MDVTASTSEPLIVDRTAEGLARLTLNRPAKANAIDANLVSALEAELQALSAEPIAIAGSGRTFAAGFDLTDVDSQSEGDLVLRFIRLEKLLQRVRNRQQPTVALIGGAAFGAGADLALACTWRVATPQAKFRFPGFRFGVALGTRHLTRMVGQDAARRILLTNCVVDAAEALEIGIVTHIVERDDLEKTAEGLIREASDLRDAARSRILDLTGEDTSAVDLADLVQSLTEGDLRERIMQFRSAR